MRSVLTIAQDRLASSKTDWHYICYEQFMQPYMQEIDEYLTKRQAEEVIIAPSPYEIFINLASCPCYDTRVVILTDYPYADARKATGRAFDIPDYHNLDQPTELKNIHRELKRELKVPKSKQLKNSLYYWSAQGALLLNNVWTAEQGHRTAHKEIGWQIFTKFIVQYLANNAPSPLVFCLWGEEVQKYQGLIGKKHLVISTPSPASATAGQGFMFSSPFSKINKFLREKGRGPIDWMVIDSARYGIFK